MLTIVKYYKDRDEFIASIFREDKTGLVPYKIKKLDMNAYPNLLEIVKLGKTIYIDSLDCYVGEVKFEGPYGEEQIFNSEYESHNEIEPEMLNDINEQVRANRKHERKLIRIGNRYK